MDEVRTVRLITFSVGDEVFVFDIMRVRQIVPYSGSTPVPNAPDFIEGITVIREEVIPIVDLRKRFFPSLGPAEDPLILVTRTPAGIIGLKVDGVRRILNVHTDEIMDAPKAIHGLKGELFIGFIKRESNVYLLLDLDALLSAEEETALRSDEFQAAADAASRETAEV
ncbi:MAG: chemotaxis protein CheW [Thermoanaerobaculia bacterium]|nr:chemotaxis protein CheW [Thermoanaerobaculia bacterium]